MFGPVTDEMRFVVIWMLVFVEATSQHLTQSNVKILRPAKCRDNLWGIGYFCVLVSDSLLPFRGGSRGGKGFGSFGATVP